MGVLYFWGAIFALSIIFYILKWIVDKITSAIRNAKCLRLLRRLQPQIDNAERKVIDQHFLQLRSDAESFLKHLQRNYPLPKKEKERTVADYIYAEKRYRRRKR